MEYEKKGKKICRNLKKIKNNFISLELERYTRRLEKSTTEQVESLFVGLLVGIKDEVFVFYEHGSLFLTVLLLALYPQRLASILDAFSLFKLTCNCKRVLLDR